MTPGNRGQVVPYLLASLGCVMGGSSGTGVGLAQSAIILGFSDGTGRSKFVAASSVLINIGGTAGGLAGGLLAQSFQGVTLWAGPIALNNYQLTFALGMVARFVSLGWLWNMPDPGARKVRDMLKVWADNVTSAVGSRMFYPLRIFGWGAQGGQSKDDQRKQVSRDDAKSPRG